MGTHMAVLIPMTTTLNVQTYDDYIARYRRFLLFDDRAEWFLTRLHHDGAKITLLGHAGPLPIFEVNLLEGPSSIKDNPIQDTVR